MKVSFGYGARFDNNNISLRIDNSLKAMAAGGNDKNPVIKAGTDRYKIALSFKYSFGYCSVHSGELSFNVEYFGYHQRRIFIAVVKLL